MPMIDVYASEGTFGDPRKLAQDLASAVMRWEQVPNLALFRDNTVAFIHQMPPTASSTVAGRNDYIRVQVLTPVAALDRDKQLGVVKELTEIVAAAAEGPPPPLAPVCSSLNHPRVAGASPVTPTQVRTLLKRPAESCQDVRSPLVVSRPQDRSGTCSSAAGGGAVFP